MYSLYFKVVNSSSSSSSALGCWGIRALSLLYVPSLTVRQVEMDIKYGNILVVEESLMVIIF